MKYKLYLLIFIIAICTGCSSPYDSLITTEDSSVSDVKSNQYELLENGLVTHDFGDTVIPDGYIALKGLTEVYTGKPVTNRYYRSELTEIEQAIYDEIYVAVSKHLDEVELSTIDPAIIETAASAVMDDFPELYYLTNYKYLKYTVNDSIQHISFVGNYSKTAEEVTTLDILVDEYTDKVISEINSDMSDYEIAKYVYEYIVLNTEYVRDSEDNQNVLSVILNGESVCLGYAKTYQLIMQRLGYEALIVSGSIIESGEPHAWVIVKLDGEYYHVDPTWGDISIEGYDSEGVNPLTVGYAYLCVPEDWITATHIISNKFDYPECNSLKCNYYVNNNLYVDSTDESGIREIFERFSATDESVITFKSADKSIYDYWVDYLFNNKHVFDYINRKLVYILDDNNYGIIIKFE